MTSNRPYLIRALYEWLVDNRQTPYFLVDATRKDVIVPREFVEDGRIVLNLGPGAVRDLELGNDIISFSARFSGKAMDVMVPPSAVLGVYSRENGQGMLFPEEGPVEESDDEPPEPPKGGGRPSLKVIK
ncbi:MAG: ClpXP protease specificity-enhancing factor [Gammaproteobacteria bacterium]|nr:MAG: ClpXP protease specificity-enhancing factor [Gammaproteobacteria bacterium]